MPVRGIGLAPARVGLNVLVGRAARKAASVDDVAQIVVVDAPDRSRFEALEEGKLVGVCDYRRSDGSISLDRVEVVPAQRGRGIGDQIVEAAVTAARAEHLEIIPHCWFAAAWLKSHPDQA